ncbi:MAG: hypothetical protein OEZ06_21945 [Myxococcales bacterium]|nr:hypothetical protein [Myxococcales bacterium]
MSENLPTNGRRHLETADEASIRIKIAIVIAVVALLLAGLAGRSEVQFRHKSDALDAQISAYRAQRWERQVLRGSGKDENAAARIYVALAGLKALPDKVREKLAASLYYGGELDGAPLALVEAEQKRIAALRDASRGRFSMTSIDVEAGTLATTPDYRQVMDAALLMLAHARRSKPAECLEIAAQTIRMGQDLVPGAPLEAASIAMRITSVAIPVIARCAGAADVGALMQTARDFHTMATSPPPVGSGIELSDLQALVTLRGLADLSGEAGDDATAMARLRRRPVLFEAWEQFGRPDRWREVRSDGYPAALEVWRKDQEWRARSSLPLLAGAGAGVEGWLLDDMRGQALLRCLTVGLSTLAERARRGKLGREPKRLDEPAMRDPFSGDLLKWRVNQTGSELTIWSVGENRRDDRASREWERQSPADVVIHLPLTEAEDEKATRKKRRRWRR